MTLTPEQIALVAHEANRAYCALHGDTSHLSWDQTRQELKDSVISGVRAISENPFLTPEQSHELWSDYKLAAGWRYGPVKDWRKKTHPNLVPYAELPAEQRVKDALFGGIVRALLPMFGGIMPALLSMRDDVGRTPVRNAIGQDYFERLSADARDEQERRAARILNAAFAQHPDSAMFRAAEKRVGEGFDPSASILVSNNGEGGDHVQERTDQAVSKELPAGTAAQADRDGSQDAEEVLMARAQARSKPSGASTLFDPSTWTRT